MSAHTKGKIQPEQHGWDQLWLVTEKAEGRHAVAQVMVKTAGEGMYDGTRCRSCGGSGVERTERDEPDWDALRKERAELAHLNGDE